MSRRRAAAIAGLIVAGLALGQLDEGSLPQRIEDRAATRSPVAALDRVKAQGRDARSLAERRLARNARQRPARRGPASAPRADARRGPRSRASGESPTGPILGWDPLKALEEEPVKTIRQPDPSRNPVYLGDFDCCPVPYEQCKGWATPSNCHLSVAIDEQNVYISTEYYNSVLVYDANTFAFVRIIGCPDCTDSAAHGRFQDPRGVASYRGELYVADYGNNRVEVFDAASGVYRRTISGGLGVALWSPAGLDVAWGELWTRHDVSTMWGDVVSVRDALTGVKKAELYAPPLDIGWTPQPLDSTGFQLWDLAVAPELGRVVAWPGQFKRGLVAALSTWEGTPVEGMGNGPCRDGHDYVWGMRWLMRVSCGGYVTEYSYSGSSYCPSPGLVPLCTPDSGQWTERRSWWSNETGLGWQKGTTRDIAYRFRDIRLDWGGELTQTEWQRGNRCLMYVVSDADIVLAGAHAERWVEPVQIGVQAELRIDGNLVATSNQPNDTLCYDTDNLSSGVHTVTVSADLSDGQHFTLTNNNLRIDHDGPGGDLDDPPLAFGTTTISGSMGDAHAGNRDVEVRVRLDDEPDQWSTLCTQDTSADGRFACSWDTTDYANGFYVVQAVMRDAVRQERGGPNSSTTERTTRVLNTNHVPDEARDPRYQPDPDEDGTPDPLDDDYPDTPSEHPLGPEDEDGPATGSQVNAQCEEDDPYTEHIFPRYDEPEEGEPVVGAATPQLALAEFMSLPVIANPLPISLFREEFRADDFALYSLFDAEKRRAYAWIVRDHGIWLVDFYSACSRYRPGVPQL